jgi:DNA-binding MarR family transcriptional regulator
MPTVRSRAPAMAGDRAAASTASTRRSNNGRQLDEPVQLEAVTVKLLATMASIRRSGHLLARQPRELLALTGPQVDLVRVVQRLPGVSVNQAAHELRLAPNTVSTLVRKLTDASILTRVADETDRRVARLHLAPTVKRKVGAFRDRREAALVQAMTQLSEREQRQLPDLVALLARVAEELREDENTL